MAGTNSPRKRIKIDVRYPTNFDPNDRISHLPDDILRHILSLITLHEVGRTSILSKRWQNVRSSNPNLDFDERVFIKNLSDNLTDITRKQKPDLMGKNVRISEHIIQNLILGSPLIESLTLVCCWNVKNIELSSLVNDKKLELQDCGENGGRFERIEFEELKLQSLSYSSDNMLRSFGYDGNNLVPLLFSLDMSSVEDAAVKMSTELNASQFFKLRSYHGKLRTFLPEELGDNSSIPSISNIKHLKIELYYPLNEKDNYGALLDGLLWSCHPETLSMELGWGYNDEVAKVLCERLGKIDPRDECCSTACTY
uniref:putative F-box/LRR-repeat protein At3g58880 n=1 Tax=Fragaria vesca subsp. vesca TaxID=101020 RepID=UPI0005CAAE6F|nr:PREDICTED: putative F-box/LRR-repeat protein At3g58880 [Fragaria vesca subsp. vesca]